MDADTYKYWGFISYSHQDRRWGEWLHRAIERYRVPARLVGREGIHGPVPSRLFPIFRDRAELPTAGGLDVELARALEASRCFILICSPAAAASRWVNEEVLRFKQLGRESRILCLIVDGEPNVNAADRPERECFPPALRFLLGLDGQLSEVAAEPLAADLRSGADGRNNARLKMIAGLLGVGFDELKRRDLQTRNRRLGALAAISMAVAALTIVLAAQAVVARRAAEHSRQQGEDLIGFMLGDLRGKLEPLGKLDILDAIGDKSMSYFDSLDNRDLSEAALSARAKALRQIGDVRFKQGRPADAAATIEAALVLNTELVRRYPEDANLQFELGQTEFWAAFAAWRAKQLDRAEKHFTAYHRISRQLVERDPNNPRWQLELAYSETNLGALASERHDYENALAHFQKSSPLLRAIQPQDEEVRNAFVDSLSWQGSTLQFLGRPRDALAALREQVSAALSIADEKSDDMSRRYRLVQAWSALGFAALAAGDPSQSRLAIREGQRLVATLIANDDSNQDYRYVAAVFDYIRANTELLDNHDAAAEESIERAQDALKHLHQRDGERTDAAHLLARSWQLRFDLALGAGNSDSARNAADAALALCDDGRDTTSAEHMFECARAHLMAWELAAVHGRDAGAVDTHKRAVEKLLESQNGGGDRVSLANLGARAELLAGRADSAAAMLVELARSGYQPPDLRQFLTRHCEDAIAKLPGLACMPRNDHPLRHQGDPHG